MGRSPLRRPGSVRRTASIDISWPDGASGPMLLLGHARDIATPWDGGAPLVLAEDRTRTRADKRVILEVTSDPPRPQLAGLVGARAGGHLRARLDELCHAERLAGAPFYLLLDDLAGATLVGGWAWSRWGKGPMFDLSPDERAAHTRRMEGVCIGFRPGSGALGENGYKRPPQNSTMVEPLPHPDDINGWHALPDLGGVNFRRARRIDVWREHDAIIVDVAFQDSASQPDGVGRAAIHEYSLTATADAKAQTLSSITATAGTLPYRECPAATVNVAGLIGTPLAELRSTVLTMLGKTAGCTHLNDALRSLAEVPRLAAALPA